MKLTSPAFTDGEAMPAKYTCDGENVSPPLSIADVPEGAPCYNKHMLTLYYRPTCPYCHKVLEAAKRLNVTLDLHDIADEANRAELVARGGKQQVPYLVDSERGVEMYESDDIVHYLEAHASA